MESQNNKIVSILPSKWKTQILEKEIIEAEDKFPNVQIRLLVDIKSRDEFKEWLTDYQTKTKSNYAICNTDIEGGKLLAFKQRLKCHHHTSCKRVYDPSVKGKTRNTNCPARITVKIHNINKNYRGQNKEKFALLKEMPCEIILVLTHNHPTETIDILRFRKVSQSVKEQLVKLFCNGHSPKTAMEMIKMDIRLHSEDVQSALADRDQCPDYNFCHSFYNRKFKEKYEYLFDETQEIGFLKKKITEYNVKQGVECAKIIFRGDQSNDYIIGIVTPIMRRINTHIETVSQKIIFDCSGKLDKNNRRVVLLLAHSKIGVLPIGLIIATEKVEDLTSGFEVLKELLGKSIFGGHPEGPRIFLTEKSIAQQNAIGIVWPKAKCLLSAFHVLQAVFKWLIKQKNWIPKNQVPSLFMDFQNILYAITVNEMNEKFEIAHQNAKCFPSYLEYLTDCWWKVRELWAMAYRDNWLLNNNHIDNMERGIRELKNDILGRIKTFNTVQAMDFMVTRYEEYIKKKLLNGANNRLETTLCRRVETASTEILNNIRKINDSMIIVPSENKQHLLNLVNIDLVICSCQDGLIGFICKHIDWANILYYSKNSSSKIDNVKLRQTYFFVATGKKALVVGLVPLTKKSEVTNGYSLNQGATSINQQVNSSVVPMSSLNNDNDANMEGSELTSGNNDDCIQQFTDTFSKISQILYNNLMKSPQEMVESAEKMLENMMKMENHGDVASAMATFGSENV